MSYIIFLDIDGVLRPTNEFIGSDEYGKYFNSDCISAFSYLLENIDAKIVISSTWKASGLSVIKEMWTKRALPGFVIDITPNEVDIVNSGLTEYYDMVDRGMEIDQWIKDNNYTGKYIILDDVIDFTEEQKKHLIKCNPDTGLTADKVSKFLMYKYD